MARIAIWGPEERLTAKPPKRSGLDGPIVTYSAAYDVGGAEVTLSVNGNVTTVPAYEEAGVSEQVAGLLEDAGFEVECH